MAVDREKPGTVVAAARMTAWSPSSCRAHGAFAAAVPDHPGEFDAAKDRPGAPFDHEPTRFQADVRRLAPLTDRTKSNS
jgi:hypothetical protein